MKRIIYLVCLLIVVAACKEVFEDPPQALLKAAIMDSSNQTTATSIVSLIGEGVDSLLYNENSIREILFPLSINDTTIFRISFDSVEDTIIFFHGTTQKYASMETGFYYEFKLDSVYSTQNRIDSIAITDSLVTKNWHENIKLYLRPLSTGSN